MSEIPSDDTSPVLSGSVTDQDEFDKFYVRTTNPYTLGRWSDGYRGIYRCNAVIEQIAGVTMNETLKSRIVGEAKFLRALMYFNLVRVFGDVPLVLTETTDSLQGYAFGRAPVADVYTQIIKDLSDAEAVLSISHTGADVGRATNGAARSLLGKVYLTQKRYADAVISFGGGGNNHPTPDLDNSYETGDPRRNVSMVSSCINSSGAKIDYYYIKKYVDPPVVSGDSEDNWYVLRYADVLLLYAEALNETGKTTEARRI